MSRLTPMLGIAANGSTRRGSVGETCSRPRNPSMSWLSIHMLYGFRDACPPTESCDCSNHPPKVVLAHRSLQGKGVAVTRCGRNCHDPDHSWLRAPWKSHTNGHTNFWMSLPTSVLPEYCERTWGCFSDMDGLQWRKHKLTGPRCKGSLTRLGNSPSTARYIDSRHHGHHVSVSEHPRSAWHPKKPSKQRMVGLNCLHGCSWRP